METSSPAIRIECEGKEKLPISKLEPFQGELKSLSEENYLKLKKELLEQGFSEPISVWKHQGHNYVLNGHQRLRVLTKMAEEGLNIPEIPISLVQARTIKDAKRKILGLAGQYGKVEEEGLYEFLSTNELEALEVFEHVRFPEIDENSFLDEYFNDPIGLGGDEDKVPEPRPTDIKLGDIYALGNHRLMCGDSTCADTVAKLMNGEKADMVFTDPPYNTGMTKKSNSDSTRLNHMFDDSYSDPEWFALMNAYCQNYHDIMKDDSAAYICLDWRRNHELIPHIKERFKLSNIIVWDKVVHGLGSDYKYTYELINVCKKGKPELDTHQGEDAEYSDVWHIQRQMGRDDEHATKKPIELVERAIRHASKSGHLIADLFLGSGSTLIACEKTGRKCFGLEIDPHYCQVIIDRWEEFTGNKAVKLI
jgi:DNA modification methylase